jgi:hypothetical protein
MQTTRAASNSSRARVIDSRLWASTEKERKEETLVTAPTISFCIRMEEAAEKSGRKSTCHLFLAGV